MIKLIGFLNSPRRDDALLKEAGVSLDRALFPLLVRLGMSGDCTRIDLASVARLVAQWKQRQGSNSRSPHSGPPPFLGEFDFCEGSFGSSM